MNKTLFIILTLILFSSQCKKENEMICNSQDPLQDLIWLKQMKHIFEMDMSPARQKISLYSYNNLSVFKIEDCVQCPDAMTIVYNCEGNKICEFGGIAGVNTCPDFETKAIYIKTLFDQ